MNIRPIRTHAGPVVEFPVRSVGILYVTAPIDGDNDYERPADDEVLEVAQAVQSALQLYGFQTEMVSCVPENFDDLMRFDWIFNLTETVHHFPLTDYQIAAEMESRGILFTGSGSEALRTCLDKSITKNCIREQGLYTPVYEVYSPGEPVYSSCLTYPLLVKPVHEDGSIGIFRNSIIWNVEQLSAHVRKIHDVYEQPALVEEYIEGEDMTAAILGNGAAAICLPLSVMQYDTNDPYNFLTFESKWLPQSNEYRHSHGVCPPDFDPQLGERIRTTALAAYHLMGCRDYASVDFRVRSGVPYVLEVNPNPCINPGDAGFVRAARAGGLKYAELVKRILDLSIQAHRVNGRK